MHRSQFLYGSIGDRDFELIQEHIGFDGQIGIIKVNGRYIANDEIINIEGEVSSANWQLGLFSLLIIFMYGAFFSAIINAALESKNDHIPIMVIAPISILHELFMFSFIYFTAITKVTKLKNDVIRELYFLTKCN